jgi:hypothetical protein
MGGDLAFLIEHRPSIIDDQSEVVPGQAILFGVNRVSVWMCRRPHFGVYCWYVLSDGSNGF